MHHKVLFTRGFGLIEIVVGVSLLTTVFVGMFGVLQLGTRLATDNKARTGALALGIERMEYIRSLNYSDIGVVGGNPSGSLVVNESLTLNTIEYIRRTYIIYIDDPKDGTGGSDSNGITNDYKKVKIEVSWVGPKNRARSSSLVSNITPLGIEE